MKEKNKIDIRNLLIKDNKLFKIDGLSVKTFIDNKVNNDFEILMREKIKIKGLKYDASNLIRLLDQRRSDSKLFYKI